MRSVSVVPASTGGAELLPLDRPVVLLSTGEVGGWHHV